MSKQARVDLLAGICLLTDSIKAHMENDSLSPAAAVPVYAMLVIMSYALLDLMEFVDEFRGEKEAGGVGAVERKEQPV